MNQSKLISNPVLTAITLEAAFQLTRGTLHACNRLAWLIEYLPLEHAVPLMMGRVSA